MKKLPSFIIAALVVAIIISAVFTLDRQELERHSEHTINTLHSDISLLARQLEHSVNQRLQLIHGLSALVRSKPDFTEQDFERFASALSENQKGIRSLQLAPNAVVTYMTNKAQNAKAIGHDLLADPNRKDNVLKAINNREYLVTGPLNLIQGGVAFIARLPIYLPTLENGEEFWGFATILIDPDILYSEAGIDAGLPNVELALRGKHALGKKGDVFYGNARVFNDPVMEIPVNLPVGTWSLGAIWTDTATTHHSSLRPLYWAGGVLFALVSGTLLFLILRYPEELRISINNATRELRESQQQLEHARQEAEIMRNAAEQANHAKSEFLANMSHELRTPMHAILSFSSLGMEKLDSAPKEKLESYFSRIHQSGQRLLNMLNDLLDLAKLESGHSSFELQEHDLKTVINSATTELEALINKKSLTLEITSATIDTVACFDKSKLIQVAYNLIANAIKFTPSGKNIPISFAATSLPASYSSGDSEEVPAVSVSIADQGIGIPEEELENVFNKFIQSSKTKTGAGGTGLGLAISREIIVGHGGRIWAENNPSGGAVFTFVIPRTYNQ